MGGRAWTEEELSTAVEERYTIGEAAEILGRTYSSVEHVRARARKGDPVLMRGSYHRRDPNNATGRTLLARTCLDCGWLLDAKFFGQVRPSGAEAEGWTWRSQCSWCRGKRVAERRRERHSEGSFSPNELVRRKQIPPQDRFPRKEDAPRGGKIWEQWETRIISSPTETIEEKAVATGRSYAAVAKRCGLNGFRSMYPGIGNKTDGQWRINFGLEAS